MDKMAATLADGNFKCIFLNENYTIPIRFSLKFVPRGPIHKKPVLVHVMDCSLFGAKLLHEPMPCWPISLMHIYAALGGDELVAPVITTRVKSTNHGIIAEPVHEAKGLEAVVDGEPQCALELVACIQK